jgi:SAM-dependent methyltransferase
MMDMEFVEGIGTKNGRGAPVDSIVRLSANAEVFRSLEREARGQRDGLERQAKGKPVHYTALEIGERFFRAYVNGRSGLTVVDIGAQDVNGSLRSVCPPGNRYIGVDFIAGKGVDIVIEDPYSLPLGDESADVIVCSSCFEHSEFFWLLFNDIQRLLKPSGLLYLNVPSNGTIHRYPVDCWRFYPDSGLALQNWGRRSGYDTTLLESFTGVQKDHVWNDFIAIFVKGSAFTELYPTRIQDSYQQFTNGLVYGSPHFAHATEIQEDQRLKLGKRLYKGAREVYGSLPAPVKMPLHVLIWLARRLLFIR